MAVCTLHVLILTLGFLASCASADDAGIEVPVLTAVSIWLELAEDRAIVAHAMPLRRAFYDLLRQGGTNG
ncbi:MAG: hypothetical protein KDC08_08160 [Actinobacteria bacterium]|nr:hypothetical protein [Actinomycetota bacterium]